MKISPFHIADQEIIPEIQETLKHWTTRDTKEITEKMTKIGTFYTSWTNDDRILAVGGFVELHEGVCEVALFPGAEFFRNFRSLCKYLKQSIKILLTKYHRVQMVCQDTDTHHRFAEFLGFKEEGILRRYNSNGDDYVMYSIVR